MRPGLQTLLAPLVLHLVLQLLKLVYLVQLVQYVLVQLVQAVPQPMLQPVLQHVVHGSAFGVLQPADQVVEFALAK